MTAIAIVIALAILALTIWLVVTDDDGGGWER